MPADAEQQKVLLLTKAVSQLKTWVPCKLQRQSASDKELEGGTNHLRIQQHPVSSQFDYPNKTVKENEISIAILKIKQKTHRLVLKEAKQAIEHLRIINKENESPEIKQSTLFIQHLLYTGQDGKVSLTANGGNLYSFMENLFVQKNNLDADEIKEIIAQVLMGVEVLHSNDLVHRDIKPQNFLVHLIEDRIYIELADLDTVAHKNIKRVYTFTGRYLAPECATSKTKNGDPENFVLDQASYKTAAKMPLDCYAVGVTLEQLLDVIVIDPPTKALLKKLSDDLKENDPAKRLTIHNAMQHPYFGNTKEECDAYFASVIKKHTLPDVFFDTYYQTDFYPADGFLIFPAQLKEIYIQSLSLKCQMEIIRGRSTLLKQEIDAIKAKMTKLDSLIKNYKKEPKEILSLIQAGIAESEGFLTTRHIHAYFETFPANSPQEKNDKTLFNFLNNRSNIQKRHDFKIVFSQLEKIIKAESNPEIRISLENSKAAVLIEASDIPSEHLPYITEFIYRLLSKEKYPMHPMNAPDGTNTLRGLVLCEEISAFKWGKLMSGLRNLLSGSVIMSTAFVTLLGSAGTSVPVLAIIGGGTLSVGAKGTYDIGKTIYDSMSSEAANKIIRREGLRLFKLPQHEVEKPVVTANKVKEETTVLGI